jgi:putative transposase
VLNYVVTSNHIHLIVKDDGERNIIPDAIGLIAARTAQEYNRRKRRTGAFWEDRYHSTAIEDGEHLLRCLVYIDLNMVRAGVVSHPSEWPHGGYNEIQTPRRKNVIIAYDRLRQFAGFDDYASFAEAHRSWVQELSGEHSRNREGKWTESIAVGSRSFAEKIKSAMGGMATGRTLQSSDNDFELRESPPSYIAVLPPKKRNIASK